MELIKTVPEEAQTLNLWDQDLKLSILSIQITEENYVERTKGKYENEELSYREHQQGGRNKKNQVEIWNWKTL